jgi:hypothetical protein
MRLMSATGKDVVPFSICSSLIVQSVHSEMCLQPAADSLQPQMGTRIVCSREDASSLQVIDNIELELPSMSETVMLGQSKLHEMCSCMASHQSQKHEANDHTEYTNDGLQPLLT